MAKSKVGPEAVGNLFKGKKPKGGSSSTGKGKQQDIELGGETKPAAGARSSGGSRSVPLDKQISSLLTKNGDLKDKSPEAVQKLTQLIGRWEVNDTARLSDLGDKRIQGSVLKYLKKSGNQEMYVSALKKGDGKLPTTALQKDYNELVQPSIARQERAPLESTGKSPTSRPDNRTGRGGQNSDTVSTQERVSEATARILDGKGTDKDFDFVLKQGLGWNDKKQTGAFLDEFQAAASTQDVNQRSQIIENMAQNAAAVGNHSKQAQPFLQRRFREYIESQLPLYEGAKTAGGGAKIGDGPLPTEKQQPLNFDGGGTAKTEGPEIPVEEPELKQPNQAANAKGTENVPPETKEPFEAQTVPPAGDVGASELQELKNWAINSIRQEVELKMGGSVDSNPAIQKKYDDLVNEFLKGIEADPDAISKLQKLREGSQPAATEAPQPQPNRQTPNQAASPGNQTRNTTQPVQPGTTPSPAPGANAPMAATGIAPPPGYKGPTPGKGGSVSGLKTGGKSEPPQKGMSPDQWKARADAKTKEFDNLDAQLRKDRRLGAATVMAAGVAGSLAWNWLNGGDDEPETEVSASSASITGDPSTSTGSASGSVADGSGGSAGGMSQEQMEYMMKLQQIRDEQKRRHVGFGNTHSGVSR